MNGSNQVTLHYNTHDNSFHCYNTKAKNIKKKNITKNFYFSFANETVKTNSLKVIAVFWHA